MFSCVSSFEYLDGKFAIRNGDGKAVQGSAILKDGKMTYVRGTRQGGNWLYLLIIFPWMLKAIFQLASHALAVNLIVLLRCLGYCQLS